jgi:hypothetical protein
MAAKTSRSPQESWLKPPFPSKAGEAEVKPRFAQLANFERAH